MTDIDFDAETVMPEDEPTEEVSSVEMSVEEQRRSFAINIAVTINSGGGIDKLLSDAEQLEEYLRTGEKSKSETIA